MTGDVLVHYVSYVGHYVTFKFDFRRIDIIQLPWILLLLLPEGLLEPPYLKVFTLIKYFLMIFESIYYFVLILYAGAFVTFHHICFFSITSITAHTMLIFS